VNVPLAGLAVLLAFPLIDADPAREIDRTFDLPGAVSVTLGITLLVFALVMIERRSKDPLVPSRLVANRNLLTAIAIAFLFMATFGSVLYFLSIYFQDVRGYDALETGAAFLRRAPQRLASRFRRAGDAAWDRRR
jgi:hypothetical protein